jgi:hypothetical protein
MRQRGASRLTLLVIVFAGWSSSGLALTLGGDSILVSDESQNRIFLINPSSGEQSVVNRPGFPGDSFS